MKKEILTACMPVRGNDALVTVLYENGKPAEIHVGYRQEKADLGWVYIGKVEELDQRLNAAFVRISPDRRVYLPLGGSCTGLKGGDEIPVQIIQEAQKTKLPRASAAIELAGKFLVLSLGRPGCSFSRRLSGEQKKRLQDSLDSCKKEKWHILFRTRAADASDEQLAGEYAVLSRKMDEILAKASSRTCYSILFRAPSLQERLLERCLPGELSRIVTDDAQVYEDLREAAEEYGTDLLFYQDSAVSLYRLRDLSSLLDSALSRVVRLRSGASLVIEQTEAFTAVDVNSARFSGRGTKEETRHQVNCEAAAEAARQIRLRQLSGTILIDFINAGSTAEEKELASLLQEGFSRDANPAVFVDFTRLHICEIVRRKTQRSLKEQVNCTGETDD